MSVLILTRLKENSLVFFTNISGLIQTRVLSWLNIPMMLRWGCVARDRVGLCLWCSEADSGTTTWPPSQVLQEDWALMPQGTHCVYGISLSCASESGPVIYQSWEKWERNHWNHFLKHHIRRGGQSTRQRPRSNVSRGQVWCSGSLGQGSGVSKVAWVKMTTAPKTNFPAPDVSLSLSSSPISLS